MFIETPRFPECISLGAMSKPRYKTNSVPVSSGYKSRNIEWAQGLHSFDFSHNAMTQAEHDLLLAFFHAIQGMGHQFRVKDPGDYATTTANGVLLNVTGTNSVIGAGGNGYGYGSLLAGKRYVAGALTTYRWLQKLVANTVTVYRNGVAVTVGAGAGQISIDVNTGRINFVADQTRSITTHTPSTLHQLTPASAFSPDFITGDRIYISGVTGSAASTLNGMSHSVNTVAASIIYLNTNTTGLTATGGTASRFVQASETLTLVCEFDVPCMFSADEASFELFNKNKTENFYRWSGINLEEDRIVLV